MSSLRCACPGAQDEREFCSRAFVGMATDRSDVDA